MHVVVHVGELGWVRERVDATRDKPHRQATATRSAPRPDPGAVLSSERVERGAHIIIGREILWCEHESRVRHINGQSSVFTERGAAHDE